MSKRDEKDHEQFEFMYIPMNKKWSVEELDIFINSVNTIYNSFYIMDMIANSSIHGKVVDTTVKQMQRYRALEPLPQWVELKESMESAYNAVSTGRLVTMKSMFTREVFRIMEQYIRTVDKLLINSIEHSSPGGIQFKAPKPITRLKSERSEESSPLEKTHKLIHESILIESSKSTTPEPIDNVKFSEMKREDVIRELMLDNRLMDPELMGIIKEILISGPVDNLAKLGILGKVEPPEMGGVNEQSPQPLRRPKRG